MVLPDSTAAAQAAIQRAALVNALLLVGAGGVVSLITTVVNAIIAARGESIRSVTAVAIENTKTAAAVSLERDKQREERWRDDFRFRRERLIEPIIAFTDDLLNSISESYWNYTERAKDPAMPSSAERTSADTDANLAFLVKLIALRNREEAVEARVIALGDSALMSAFSSLSRQGFIVRKVANEQGFGAAYEEAKKASLLGAKVLGTLCKLKERESKATPETPSEVSESR
jgi:hypothetical protein